MLLLSNSHKSEQRTRSNVRGPPVLCLRGLWPLPVPHCMVAELAVDILGRPSMRLSAGNSCPDLIIPQGLNLHVKKCTASKCSFAWHLRGPCNAGWLASSAVSSSFNLQLSPQALTSLPYKCARCSPSMPTWSGTLCEVCSRTTAACLDAPQWINESPPRTSPCGVSLVVTD